MIIKPSERKSAFEKMRKGELFKKGLSTGIPSLDEYMKLAKGYLLIATGYPSSGKSEIVDAIVLNMTLNYGWKTLFYSPENHPVEQHMVKIAEKFIGKHIMSFSKEEIDKSMKFMQDHFTWMYPENPELDVLLSLAKTEHDTNGLDCVVIDPWNAVTHKRASAMVHEYLSEELSKVIRFARTNNILFCVVAHPKIPQKDKNGDLPVPTLYDISDGAMWRNKAEYGIVIHRPDMSRNGVDMYIQKCKYKWMGKLGVVHLDYNYENGRFKGVEEKEFLLPTEIESPF